MSSNRIKFGRALWVLLALNATALFVANLYQLLHILQNPSEQTVQGLVELGLPITLYSGFYFALVIIQFLTYFVVSLLIFLRRPSDGFALFTAIFLVSFGAAGATPEVPEFLAFLSNLPTWNSILWLISSLFSWTFLIAFLILFPDGHFVPRWSWVPALIGGVMTTAWAVFPSIFFDETSPFRSLVALCILFVCAASFYAQYWRYRYYSTTVQRAQTKWFVYALAIFFAATFVYFLEPFFLPVEQTPSDTILAQIRRQFTGSFSAVVIPIAVGFAILRYRLWDIDVIIRKTLTYAILSAALILVYFVTVLVLQRVFALVTGGQQSEIITVLSTLAIAALFVPLRTKIQDLIDRRFYRKKYNAQQVLTDFANTVRDETDLEKLTTRLINVVDDTMQPSSISVSLRQAHATSLNNRDQSNNV